MTKFYIQTAGCSQNVADSEQMAGLLQEAGFTLADSVEDADLIIFNTCTVKSPSVNFFFKKLEQVKQQFPNKTIVVAGCIPQTERKQLKEYPLIGTKQIHNIVEVVKEALQDNIVKMLEMGKIPPLDLPKIRKNSVIEIIPISRGCLNACTFCKTKHARGHLQSYPIKDITGIAESAIKDGVKEIWLTAQDTMCYGFDIGTNLACLIKKLVEITGVFKIRIGMGNPVHLLKIKDELIPMLNNEKVFKFIHLPIQSGSNRILANMKRGNTAEEFLELIKEIKEKVPNITLATDVIAGFPGESEKDFQKTLKLVKEISPDIINISRFWMRPGTFAAKMKQLPGEIVKKRSKLLTEVFNKISMTHNEKWLGWVGEIVIDERSKFENQWIGRNDSYKPVIITGDFKFGEVIKVKIKETWLYDLRGDVVT